MFSLPFTLLPYPEGRSAPSPSAVLPALRAMALRQAFCFTPGASPRAMRIAATEGVIYFIGDLHGDYLALQGILRAIEARSPDATLVFLGDLIDRGPFSLEVLLKVLGLMLQRPGRILLLAGDHETGLQYDAETKHFTSKVTPAEFTDFLNAHPELEEFGQELIRFFGTLPCALFFGDGLVVTHGGVPHADLLNSIHQFGDLNATECLEDFTWNRLTDALRKRPNRNCHGSDFGQQNLAEFCAAVAACSDQRPQRLICGHQHPGAGYQLFFPDTANPALCINSSFFHPTIPDEPKYAPPCFAQYHPGTLPDVFGLDLKPDSVDDFYGLPPAQATPQPPEDRTVPACLRAGGAMPIEGTAPAEGASEANGAAEPPPPLSPIAQQTMAKALGKQLEALQKQLAQRQAQPIPWEQAMAAHRMILQLQRELADLNAL